MTSGALRRALVVSIRGTSGHTRDLLNEQLIWNCSAERDEELAARDRTVLVEEPRIIEAPIILVQCVSDNERAGIRTASGKHGLIPGDTRGGQVVVESLGRCGVFEMLLLQTRAGSTGPTAAQGVVSDAIDLFGPQFVIAVGVAFGLKTDELFPSDPTIAIAETSKNYERARLGTDPAGELLIHERGVVEHTDPMLSMALRALAQHMGLRVAYGEMLCGDKLVDNLNFRSVLKSRFPQAIAGEMEGTGLASACLRRRKPWAIVKGISDLGDGRKNDNEAAAAGEMGEDERQIRASEVAMDLVLSVISKGYLQT